MKTKKIVFITGATSGIGKACAEKFVANNFDVIITGRRNELLKELAAHLEQKYHSDILCLNFDVRKLAEVKKAITSLEGKWKEIDILVNNAGLAAGLDPIDKGNIDDWETMIDTNIKGLLYVSRQIIPIMTSRNSGHIINIGSIAGKEVYANGNVYCATKSAVDSLTKAMRIDLLKYGIKVTAVHPGAVETEFSLVRLKGNEQAAKNVYKGFKPLIGADIAEIVHYVSSQPEHVNINDIVVMPTAQASTAYFFKKE
jgi:NADP-dependent 3-hydroxy acid dehydrogenase YdfG